MKASVESTGAIVPVTTSRGAMHARVWKGITDTGVPFELLVVRVAVERGKDAAEFERDLREVSAPEPAISAFSLGLVI
jgi:hypothetical protein